MRKMWNQRGTNVDKKENPFKHRDYHMLLSAY